MMTVEMANWFADGIEEGFVIYSSYTSLATRAAKKNIYKILRHSFKIKSFVKKSRL